MTGERVESKRASALFIQIASFLCTIALALSFPVAASASPGQSGAQTPPSIQVRCSSNFPGTQQDCDQAFYVWNFAWEHNFTPPPNYVGGKVFGNTDGKLPPPSGTYLEYDIYQRPPPGTPRGPQRLIVDTGDGAKAYYSPDHYVNFVDLKFFAPSGMIIMGGKGHEAW